MTGYNLLSNFRVYLPSIQRCQDSAQANLQNYDIFAGVFCATRFYYSEKFPCKLEDIRRHLSIAQFLKIKFDFLGHQR